MNKTIGTLKDALRDLHRDDLKELTLEELGSLQSDLDVWSGLTYVESMMRRAAMREEESE